MPEIKNLQRVKQKNNQSMIIQSCIFINKKLFVICRPCIYVLGIMSGPKRNTTTGPDWSGIAGTGELAVDSAVSASIAIPPANTADAAPEPSEDDASAQLLALERELDLELQSADNSVASLHPSAAMPGSTAGGQTADAHGAAATSSSEISLQVAGTEPDTSSMAAANQARVWPVSAALARSRWRILLGRRTKDLPSEASPPTSTGSEDAASADAATGMMSSAGIDAPGDESAAAAAAVAPSPALEPDASPGLHAGNAEPARATAFSHSEQNTISQQHQGNHANELTRAALNSTAGTVESGYADDGPIPVPEAVSGADAMQPPTAMGSQQATRRKFSFRSSLKEVAAVPAVLRQVS